jgi:hypothetical protein
MVKPVVRLQRPISQPWIDPGSEGSELRGALEKGQADNYFLVLKLIPHALANQFSCVLSVSWTCPFVTALQKIVEGHLPSTTASFPKSYD